METAASNGPAEWRSRGVTPFGPRSKDHPLLKGNGMDKDAFKDEYRL